jgi:hypothetical protein
MKFGQIVKCIDGGGVLDEGSNYVVDSITEKGNYRLWDIVPPDAHTSFNSWRFEDTGENIFDTWQDETYLESEEA